MRVRRVALVAVALALVALVNAGVVGVAALVGERSAGAVETRVGAATLSAGVSTHYPCGDPIWLKARVRNAAGHGVKGVKVTFSFKLKSGTVRRQATTDSRGVARVKITPVPDTAPQVVRVDGKVKAVYRGVTLTAAT